MHNSDIDDQFQMQTINTSVEETDNQHSMYIYIYIYIYSKELRIMRYLITRGLCMPRTSLSLVVDTKKRLADLRG